MIIARLWRQQPGKYFCVSTKSATGKWRDHFFERRQLGKELRDFIADNMDKDVYFCPHGFKTKRRVKDQAVLPKLLWSDLDDADPKEIPFRPTVAFESSPGRYVGLWVTDETVDEELNRALAYNIDDADRSGWDVTQVLRMPGTRNHKYASKPRVRILWQDGPDYRLSDLRRKLSSTDEEHFDGADTDASDVFRDVEKQLPRWVRRELIGGKPKAGDDRSKMIWKLTNTMLEAGLTQDQVFVLIRASKWNKFAGRRAEEDQLRREIRKGVNAHLKGEKLVVSDKEDDDNREFKFLAKSMDEVEERNYEWLWHGRIALGELTILEGDPGLGKSYLAQIIAGCVVDGRKLPGDHGHSPLKGRVAYFDMENSSDTVTKKRLVGNGVKNLRDYYQEEEPFSVDDEDVLDELYEALEKFRPTLVVFDTINTYIGRADTNNSAQVQQAFSNFRDIAMRFNCAVLVLRHLTKSNKGPALYRGQGSIAFTGLARFVMTVGMHPDEEEQRVIALTKTNLTAFTRSLTFTIRALPDTMKQQDRSRFEWGEEVDISADDMLSADPSKAKEKNNDDEAIRDLLAGKMKDGPIVERKLRNMAEARGFTWKDVKKIADDMGVHREAVGRGQRRTMHWSLPDRSSKKGADA